MNDPVWQFIFVLVVIIVILTIASVVKYLYQERIEKEK